MAIYRVEKYAENTYVEIECVDKVLFNRLDVAIDHIFKEFEDKKNKESE